MTEDFSEGGDLMLGAARIARFLNELFDGEEITDVDVWNWCRRNALPHSHIGAKLVGSKARIRQHLYPPSSQGGGPSPLTRPMLDLRS